MPHCASGPSAEGDATGVRSMLDCALLDIGEDRTSVSTSEDNIIRVGALPESSPLECSPRVAVCEF